MLHCQIMQRRDQDGKLAVTILMPGQSYDDIFMLRCFHQCTIGMILAPRYRLAVNLYTGK
ncbi:MAG: hypothetical protein WBM38_01640 [Arenicellales bacterium]